MKETWSQCNNMKSKFPNSPNTKQRKYLRIEWDPPTVFIHNAFHAYEDKVSSKMIFRKQIKQYLKYIALYM